jgi:hypothetical protein
MKKSFSINAKGTLSNLLQSISLQTGEGQKAANNLLSGDPARSCVAMVATKNPEVSLF